MRLLLWVIASASLFLLLYTWIGYPVLLYLFRKLHSVQLKRERWTPPVSVIIAACNERDGIVDRIDNLLQSHYPAEKLEVLVASDGSTDGTEDQARGMGDSRISVLHFAARRGRAAVHNDAALQARGEILVFTDVDTRFEPDFLARIVEPFADARVGCASGLLKWFKPDSNYVGGGRGAYWNFEYMLRTWESDAGILCLASGPCMAVRKALYRPLASPSYDVDFMTPLDVVEAGHLAIHEPAAIGREVLFDRDSGEFRAEVRMVSRNLGGYLDRRFLIGRGVKARMIWSLFSHKVLRWMSPFFQVALLLSTALLRDPIARILLGLQIIFYAIALVSYVGQRNPAIPGLLRLPYAFCLANASFMIGVIRAVRGTRVAFYDKAV